MSESAELSVFRFTDYRTYLRAVFTQRKQAHKAWSHRFIAQKVGLKSGGHISLILNGKANLKDKVLDAMIGLLKLSSSEALYFRYMVYYNQATEHREQKHWFERMMACRESDIAILEAEQYTYYSRWYYSAVREILSIVDFRGEDYAEYQNLGRRILPPLHPAQVRESIDLLRRLTLIEPDSNGYLRPVNAIISTGPQLHSLYFNEHISNILELAHRAVQTVPLGEKYNSWISMAISGQSFHQVVEELRQTRKRILKIVEQERNPERVFHLNLNLFPFTQKMSATKKALKQGNSYHDED